MEDVVPKDLPFNAEYAKTGRGACKGCQSHIEKDELKLGAMVQSRFHDGKDALWYHFSCFFSKARVKNVGDIAHFEQLRYSDQERIKKKIAGATGGTATTSKGKLAAKTAALKDFSIAYAVSSRSTCQACDEKILKDDIRVSKKDYESPDALRFGKGNGMDRWHHLECFVKIREPVEFFESGKLLTGYKDLDKEDKEAVAKKLPAIKPTAKSASAASEANGSSSSGSKRKLDENAAAGSSKRAKKADNSVESQIKKQMELFYKYRDAANGLPKATQLQIFSSNKQQPPSSVGNEILDMIGDIMTFGALKPCSKCKTGQFFFRSGIGYQCLGDLNEFTKCMNVTDEPDRVPFKIPNDLREVEPFNSYKFKPQTRILQKIAPTAAATSTSGSNKPKLMKRPLEGFSFMISFAADKEKEDKLKNKIVEFGGRILKSKSTKAAALITTEAEVASNSAAAKYAAKKEIPVVSVNFAETVTELNYNLVEEMNKHLICDWITDVSAWLRTKNGDFEEKETKRKETTDKFEKKLTSVKLKMKGGAVVDPESDLEDVGHVLKDGNRGFFNCVLNRTSIEEGKNSYYKQQIIEADSGRQYWVFQAWGRIGTVIGGTKLHENLSKEEAIEIFTTKYHGQTGNIWGRAFQKLPGRYTMLELDYGEKEHLNKLAPSMKESTLPLPVQELVCLIFDVERMKQAMMEFELNLEEMPLGKISRKQILSAYSAIGEISTIIQKASSGDSGSIDLIRDVTNRFYTMIPHNFGSRMPPLLNTEEIVKTKLEMLESLLEIELAYEMLLEGDKGGESSMDAHYKTLNAAIDPVESGSEEFAMLQKYLKNTHADTHSGYTLDVEHIFKVNRKGEQRQYRPFQKLHNRKLLWHGSRTTNFAGILSQGLRIAPPEAPVTGYMFGKGIYFADMVSKSANYCFASRDNHTGLLLVCEVALGNMFELKEAKDTLKKAPKDCHSVKGCGQTQPNSEEALTLPDGVEVPLGKPKASNVKSDLLYNEYIVYDTAQVNIRYLMKVNFNFSTGGRRR